MPPDREPARIDPATGEKLKPGHLTRAELAEHIARSDANWKRWAFGERPEGEWTMTPIGWIRSGQSKRSR